MKKIDELRSEIQGLKAALSKERKPSQTQYRSKIIRPKELAEMLSISIPTLYRWEKKGELPQKIALGGRTMGWLRSDIDEWLNSEKLI